MVLEKDCVWERIEAQCFDLSTNPHTPIEEWQSNSKWEIRLGFAGLNEAEEFHEKVTRLFREDYEMNHRTAMIYLGRSTTAVLSWEIFWVCFFVLRSGKTFSRFIVETIAIPRMILNSMAAQLCVTPCTFLIDVVAHYDGAGNETFVQFKAINPTECEIWTHSGCSTPEILCGFG